MGGNARAVYRNTGTVQIFDGRLAYAEKIDLQVVGPENFVYDVENLIHVINSKTFVWDNLGRIFFGSFETLRDPNISKQEFVQMKKFIGDVDVSVPIDKIKRLHDFLLKHEGKDITSFFTYVGQNRQEFSGKKVNSIFFYKRVLPGKFLQIDFEGLTFSSGNPPEYVRFMRSSPWKDMKEGIKGLAHKYLLACIAHSISHKSNIVVLTPKSPLYPPSKIKTKLLDEVPCVLTFSKEGLREKLSQQMRMGFPVMHEGKYAFKEIPKNESKFETNLEKIFKLLFGRNPSGNDIQNFYSYLGTLDLCQKYLSRGKIEKMYEYLVTKKLWGSEGQALSRDSIDEDRTIKENIVLSMEQKFPYLVGNLPLEKIIEEYYRDYEVRDEE